MKSKFLLLVSIVMLTASCTGASNGGTSSANIDFNADVALIAQGVEKFEKISAEANSVENEAQYSGLVDETGKILDEIAFAVDVFTKHINDSRELLPSSDTPESPSFNKLLAWANGYSKWVYYQKLTTAMGKECVSSNLGFKGCLVVNLPETLENERLSQIDLKNAIAGIQEWRSSLGYN